MVTYLYQDIVRDQYGRTISGALVAVVDAYTNVAAVLTNSLGASIGNPVTTDDDGSFSFYTVAGNYKLQYRYGGRLVESDITFVGPPLAGLSPATLALLAAPGASDAMGFLPDGTGAVARVIGAKLREVVSTKDFGVVGNGSVNDTPALQAAVNAAIALGKPLRINAANVGSYIKVIAPISITSSLVIVGDGEEVTTILGVGMSAGQNIIDYNCSAANVVEHCGVFGVTIRSDNGLPNALRVKNVSLSRFKYRAYNVAKGMVVTGTRCFSNVIDVEGYSVVGRTISVEAFTGGGQCDFRGSYSGAYGFYVENDSTIAQSTLDANFEGCGTNSLLCLGTVDGWDIIPRTENCFGDDLVFYPTAANEVSGLNIHGGYFTANSAVSTAITLGGNGGPVRGFSVTGNKANNSSQTQFVKLNGDGESGLIAGNKFAQAGTQAINVYRSGVVAFSNENSSGKCAEYFGDSGDNVPLIDASVAALGAIGTLRFNKIGRIIWWQAIVTYPATGSGAAAVVSGLPYTVSGGTNQLGRAGAHVDVSNVGSSVGIFQGVGSTTGIAFYNPVAMTVITNATLSGKTLYMSGQYTT